ncbi:hypothetical protein SAMN05660206_11837 [Sphingobacterium wenxiniae]|uniref:Uncharacterized protein n=1 Tax=Sphingobacterium wenxiniae TaxID=683125 RepID=A0A1I6VWG1_9SPHI|nr:hypothetical protein SAMN05660206_11837 [Sphingobacterium wenxiniae]
MIKKEKMKTITLEKNPYMYYMTNWGFVEQNADKMDNQSKKSRRS